MTEYWNLLSTEGDEAVQFAGLSSVRRYVEGPAAPPNRFRQVHRVRAGDRVYYLKEFRLTQRKNRWRNLWTRPRCELDAERERLVAEALMERGVAVARPVACGREGASSYYLCAEIRGEPLADRIAARSLTRECAHAAAAFAGRIFAGGVHLQDLSCDHVFVRGDGSFAVIDLHNGAVRPGRRPSRRTAVRVLRRFAKSVRGLPVPRRAALGFATRLLAGAGLDLRSRRAVVERAPPFDTHGRYEVPGRSRAYRNRSARRTAEELAMLKRVWPGRTGDLVVDSPAGAGRLARFLREQLGATRIGADRAMAMLRESRGGGDAGPLLQSDALELPFADRSVDGVVVFRFLHHLEEEVARRVATEAARVAKGYVVLSFFHPVSVHGALRACRGWLGARARTRFSVSKGRVAAWMRQAGFELVAVAGQQPYLRDFWIASFRRMSDGSTAD